MSKLFVREIELSFKYNEDYCLCSFTLETENNEKFKSISDIAKYLKENGDVKVKYGYLTAADGERRQIYSLGSEDGINIKPSFEPAIMPKMLSATNEGVIENSIREKINSKIVTADTLKVLVDKIKEEFARIKEDNNLK